MFLNILILGETDFRQMKRSRIVVLTFLCVVSSDLKLNQLNVTLNETLQEHEMFSERFGYSGKRYLNVILKCFFFNIYTL